MKSRSLHLTDRPAPKASNACLVVGCLLILACLGTVVRVHGQAATASMPFPQFNSSYIAGTTLNIQNTITTPANTTITKVDLYYDTSFFTGGSGIDSPTTGTLIVENLAAPYAYDWTPPPPTTPSRNYQIRAVVTNVNASGTTTTSFSNGNTKYVGITVYRSDYSTAPRRFYVSSSLPGNNSNNGTSPATPYLTIQRAADGAAPGDTIFVMAGNYSTTSTNIVGIQRTGLPNKWITFKPYQTDKPKLVMGNNNWQAFNVLPAAAYIRIQGFEVLIADNNVHDCAGAGIGAIESDYVTIEDNITANNSWYTVYGTSGISLFNSWNSDNSTDTKMIIRRNKSYGNQLKIAWNIGGTGTNCRFYDGNGIILDNNRANNPANTSTIKNPLGDYLGRMLVENNLCYLNGGRGLNVNYTDNVTLLNNTTYRNGLTDQTTYNSVVYAGIESEFIAQGSSGISVYNNIFSGRPGEKVTEVNGSAISHNNNLTFEGTGTSFFSGNQNKFTAKPLGERVALAWATASEANSAYFEVERSQHLGEFGRIGRIAAAGESKATRSYGLIDEKPLAGTSYYRLKQVDRDGTTAYSKVVAVTMDNLRPSLELLGNPVETGAIRVATRNLDGATYGLTTQSGQSIRLNAQPQANGEWLIVPAQTLPVGVYLLQAQTGSLRLTQKVLVR